MNAKTQAFLSTVLFIGVLFVNSLANALPINGLDTGQISGLYPNNFVPDGLTFSIWAVIYLLLLGFVVYQWVAAFSKSISPDAQAAIAAIAPLFWISCLLNMSWIFAWHYLQVVLSLIIMVAFLLTLILIFIRLMPRQYSLSPLARFFIVVPFVVYLAWICVATVANTTAMLVHYDWGRWGISEALWSQIMIGVVCLLTVMIVVRFRVPAFALVVAWAAWGIYRGQWTSDSGVAFAAMVLAIVALSLALFALTVARKPVIIKRH